MNTQVLKFKSSIHYFLYRVFLSYRSIVNKLISLDFKVCDRQMLLFSMNVENSFHRTRSRVIIPRFGNDVLPATRLVQKLADSKIIRCTLKPFAKP